MASAQVSNETIRIGIYENPPKIFRDARGAPSGFWPDVIDATTGRLGIDYEYVDCRWEACLTLLETGEIDVMPDVAITPAREERFRFGRTPVLFAWSMLITSQDSSLWGGGGLDGRRISVVADSVQESRLRTFLENRGFEAEILPVESMDSAVGQVKDGIADVAITNNYFATETIDDLGLRALNEPFIGSALYFAFSPDTNQGLIEAFDLAIFHLQNSQGSAIAAAMQRWIYPRDNVLPGWVVKSIIALMALLGLSVLVMAVLRRMVNLRTASLNLTVKQLENALDAKQLAERSATERRRMEAVGQLVGGVAHDFNNLLTVISGNLETLLDEVSTPSARSRIDSALEATDRGAGLTQQLLSFGRKAPLHPENLDLNAAVQDIADMLRRTVSEQITIETQLDRSDPVVRIDGAALRNAILNLAFNARDAIQDAGRTDGLIQISTFKTEVPDNLFLERQSSAKALAVVEVKDNGRGMSSETEARLFEPFFTTKKQGRGAGMGLPMVLGFVQQSSCEIAVENLPGEGATFRLGLPIVRAQPVTQAPEVHDEIEDATVTKHVLLVEDEAMVLNALERQISSRGFRITSATNGDMAWQFVQNGLQFDVLVTDVIMPGEIQGLELARRVADRFPSVAIVILSGYSEDLADPGSEFTSKATFLSKPVRRNKLVGAIQSAANNRTA